MTTSKRNNLSVTVADFLTRRSGWTISTVLALTVVLLVPTFLMRPTEQASQAPGGPVFDLQDLVNDRFTTRFHIYSFIVEDPEGDILRQAPLWELYRNEQALRESDLKGYLFSGYDVDTGRRLQGVFTIADAVQALFSLDPRTNVTLETATDAQVKEAVGRILASPGGEFLRASLSKDATSRTVMVDGREVVEWRARAISVFLAADNEKLGGGPLNTGLTNDAVALEKERFGRRVQEILRGEENSYRMWGLAIDVNLTSMEQGRTAVPFIAATVALVLVVVGMTLRSVRAVGLGFCGLLVLLVWLKGITNLIGLKSSLTLDLIVPIAMISLGADFLIHAVHRYNEERERFPHPAPALRAGLAGVLGALVLATLSDGIAFLANVTSGIETIIGFGIAAGVAVLSSFVIMGILIPLALMRLDQRKAAHSSQLTPVEDRQDADEPVGAHPSRSRIAWVVVELARVPWAALPLTAVITAAAVYLSFQLEPKLDIKDFFDSDSDFVVGLDKLEEHTSETVAGEPAVIYMEGDLTARESLDALKDLLDRLASNETLGNAQDGTVSLYNRTVFDLLRRVTDTPVARQRVLEATGVSISDVDADGIPDTPEQTRAAYDYMIGNGVPLDDQTMAYDPLQVREVLYHGGEKQAIILIIGVLGSREQANLRRSRESLEQDLAPLHELPSITAAGITGSPFTREATLTATTRALTISLPVAVAACLLLLTIWMRSLGFAIVTIIPIGLVVSWLYAFMYLTGYSLNLVTATIAAVSIGVGIDYSIHMTQRFRQELAHRCPPVPALRSAASGTGVALAGSAASSIIGFVVLGFAPMPLFSTYGIISAVMILMAAIASLLVLPSLLLIVARLKQSL